MVNHFSSRLLLCNAGSENIFLKSPGLKDVRYSEYLALTGRMANAMLAKNVRPGDRVVIRAEKSVSVLAACHAAVRAGAIAVPVNPSWDQKTTWENLTGIAPRLVIETSDHASPSGSAMILDANGEGSFAQLAAAQTADFREVARCGDEAAFIAFTSGTTNAPKGCVLSHGNLVSNAETLAREWRFSADDLLIHTMPIYHTHGLLISTNVILSAGASMAFVENTDSPAIMDAFARATVFMGIPTHFSELASRDELCRDKIPNMRLFVSGGAPLSEQVLETFEVKTGYRILERHGMTEASVFVSNPYVGQRKAGTVGLPLPSIHLRIVDLTTGAPVQPEVFGRVQVKGPNVFIGYWNDLDKTKKAFSRDGYFETGDVGRLDADGYLEIAGRLQDMIRSPTGWVNARKIEVVLEEYPFIIEAAVIGISVPGSLQEHVVAVVKAENAVALDESQIKRFLSARLSPGELPHRIIFAESLPRSPTGKLQKRFLRQSFSDLFAT